MTSFSPVGLRIVRPEWVGRVPSPAHDSLTPSERQDYISTHPDSYLAVTRSPEDVPGVGTAEVLSAARRALDRLVDGGAFSDERRPQYYAYQLEQRVAGRIAHQQTGVVGGLSIADFEQGVLRPHERIHAERAAHMAGHLDAVGVQSSPVTVAVRDGRALRALLETSGPPLAEAHGDDGLTQRIWPIEDPDATDAITTLVGRLDTYLIDGHHRAAATALHRDHLAAGATGGVPGPAAWLLTALFGADQLLNRPFHREVLGIALRTFIAALGPQASWRDLEAGALADRDPDEIAVHGSDRWIAVRIPLDDDPILELDPARIDRYLLHQALGLDPERRDGRVRYRPGSVFSAPGTDPGSSSSDDSVLFVAREVPVETVLDLADRGRVLPPKSTYFEPKVRSGVFLRAVR